MNEFLLTLTREKRLFPQSPDDDLASRLVGQSRRSFRAARRLAGESPESAVLLAYLAAHQLGRGLLAEKGYRPGSLEPHRTVGRAVAHWLPAQAALVEALREHWDAEVGEPDMPPPGRASRALVTRAGRLLAALETVFLREFPAFKPAFRSKAASISAERSFRD